MRFPSSTPALILSLPLLAIAAPNGSDEPGTSTQYATETHTITRTQLRATLTSTYMSYFPIIAATDSVSGPFPDIPNPTLTGSAAATQILVALLPTTTTASSSTKSRSATKVRPSGTGPGTVTTPLVLASATNPATASPPIAPYTGAAAAGMRAWGSGVVLVGAAVGFAAGLL